MLSKLHARGAHTEVFLPPAVLPFEDLTFLEKVSGGTLGVCFRAKRAGVPLFFKTHGTSLESRANLAKEIDLLTYVDGAALHVQSFTTEDGRLWLMMDVLSPAEMPEPARIRKLTAFYSEMLALYSDRAAVSPDDNLAQLLVEAERSFAMLTAGEMLGPQLQRAIPSFFAHLRQSTSQMHPRLCHGDLGPRNLMTDGTRLFAIDWEDAFWGVEGYDYLYWLTFFENRRHYGPAMFGHTPWDKQVEVAVLLMVLVIKCGISLRDETHGGNRLSFDQRLMEILTLA